MGKTRTFKVSPAVVELCEHMVDGWEVCLTFIRPILRRRSEAGAPYPYHTLPLRRPTLEAAERRGLVVIERGQVTLTDNGRVVGAAAARHAAGGAHE